MLDERFLDRVELITLRQPLDGHDFLPVHPDGELAARVNIAAIDDHRARAALASVAADLGAREAQFIAQDLGESAAVFHLDTIVLAVDFEVNYRFVSRYADRLGYIGLCGIGIQEPA